MTELTCGLSEALREGYLALTLEAAREREVAAHIRACRACADWLCEREPALVLVPRRPRALPEAAWHSLEAELARAVAAEPRVRSRSWFARWLVPALAPAAALLFVVSATLYLASRRDEPLKAVALGADPMAGADQGFVYLPNPQANVSHFLVAGEGVAPVKVTLVVDEAAEDLF